MKVYTLVTLIICSVICSVFIHASDKPHSIKYKYEYKYSFKGPYISHGNQVPFWNHFNDASLSKDKVRLAPSLKDRHGSVWSKYKFPHVEWQIQMSFRVSGRALMGADGLAVWYVETPNQSGNVFGSLDKWRGLAVIFDSFDNDNKKNNPSISLLVNDGTISFDHASDGHEQIKSGCMTDFRNTPYPSKIRLIYLNRQLRLYVDDGTNYVEEYTLCCSVNDVYLPSNYYFGISAATGGLADDHDILKFSTWSLKAVTEDVLSESDADEKEASEQYEKKLEEYQAEQDSFKEKHPDKVKTEYGRPEDLFQGSSSKELEAVFEVQNSIKEHINALLYTIGMIEGKQDTVLQSLGEPSAHVEMAKSHQMMNSMTLQQLNYQHVKNLQSEIETLKTNVLSLSFQLNKAGVSDEAASMNSGKLYESQMKMANIMEKFDLIQDDLLVFKNTQEKSSSPTCPKTPEIACAPVTLFVGVAVAEVLLLFIYYTCKRPSVDVGKKYF